MTRILANAVAAELVKLRGLPATLAAGLGTLTAAIILAATAAVIAASAAGASTATSAAGVSAGQVTLQTIPLLQIGPILLGVLTVATEYTGHQIHTTLTATPHRPLLLAGKTIAYLTTATTTSAAAIGAGLATARITLAIRGHNPTLPVDPWPVAGATVHLVLVGLLALALTTLLRSLIPPLVTMLTLVLIASPLLANFTAHARWLPDRAGSLLYLPDADPVLTPATGTLVLLAWITATGCAAVVTCSVHDA